jgi:hypothetical protein
MAIKITYYDYTKKKYIQLINHPRPLLSETKKIQIIILIVCYILVDIGINKLIHDFFIANNSVRGYVNLLLHAYAMHD